MTEKTTHTTWLRAIKDVAKEQSIEIPPLIPQAMGVARTETQANGRFVTLKRRLVPAAEAVHDGMEWTLWRTDGEYPIPEITYRQPAEPKPEAVALSVRVLKGWFLDNWSVDETKAIVGAATISK